MTNGSHIREENLELYALGALPENEAAAVEAHVGGCSECARKLAKVRGHVAMLAFAAPQEKPATTVKEQLFARIAAERGAGNVAAKGAHDERRPVVRDERREATPWWNWVMVPAAVALAAVCLLLAWQNRKLGERLKIAQRAASEFEKEREHVEELVGVLAAPDTITVKLAGTSDATQAQGVVKYNKRTGTMLYSAQQLPALPAQKVYQMWLVPTNGAPISAGVFTPAENGQLLSAQVPANTEPKAFAVTIEPAGGVAAPTGAKVLLGAS